MGTTKLPRDKTRRVFYCPGCGYENPKWMGFCPSCGDQAPLAERPQAPRAAHHAWLSTEPPQPQELSRIPYDDGDRLLLGFGELNNVLGGGVVAGSVVLMAGEPGVGKSTLLLQAAGRVAADGGKVLYVTGEESPRQIRLRAQRIGSSGEGVYLLPETDVAQITEQLERFQPTLAIVDSIQTLYAQEIPSGPGSVAQVRECALRLMRWAKARAAPVLIAGHVTKDGTLAGPRVLEHMVDVVLYLEGEELNAYRILRGTKNRFGSTNEVAIFQMGSNGLEEVTDPSRVLLSQHREGAVGSAIVPILEGSRPLMVEIQALTSPSFLAVPRRVANGVDYNRLLMLVAVLSRRTGLGLSNQDIIVNVVAGLRIREPAADLAIAVAIASSFRNTPVTPRTTAVGEVGLSGELRAVPQLQRRLSEATRLGFGRCVLPPSAREDTGEVEGIEAVYAPTLARALRECLPKHGADATADPTDDEIEKEEL